MRSFFSFSCGSKSLFLLSTLQLVVFNKTKELLKLTIEALFPVDDVSLTLSGFSTLAGQRQVCLPIFLRSLKQNSQVTP